MLNRSTKAREWLERYLLNARDHRDLEQFVLIEGRAKGFSPKQLAKAATDCRFERSDGWWGLSEVRLEALQIRARLAQGPWRPAPQAVGSVAALEPSDAVGMLSLRVSRRRG
jgi:hypothetical protein